MINKLKNKVINESDITKEEAMSLIDAPLEELCVAADEIRAHFCGSSFDLCSIINAKSGRCPENCRYCAQSAHYDTGCEVSPLVDIDEAVRTAKLNEESGILRFSLVTSGRHLTDNEVDSCCDIIRAIKKATNISICGSFGLLNEEQYRRLKEAGLTRVHNNLESSENFFPNVCTTHTHTDKLDAIHAAQAAGLKVCSGGIMGLGETMEDRIDMALELRELGILSIPVNMLNPIKGTPLENNAVLADDEMHRICAIYRFINPKASIRLAGGRGLMSDMGEGCFRSGANAAITMNMLTTSGITVKDDMQMLDKLGFTPQLQN
ncbi:MAG: biotin synthase BioB [Clostridiales bacterium]|nr:biotin synthase BioB [Clostridiales bacterium]